MLISQISGYDISATDITHTTTQINSPKRNCSVQYFPVLIFVFTRLTRQWSAVWRSNNIYWTSLCYHNTNNLQLLTSGFTLSAKAINTLNTSLAGNFSFGLMRDIDDSVAVCASNDILSIESNCKYQIINTILHGWIIREMVGVIPRYCGGHHVTPEHNLSKSGAGARTAKRAGAPSRRRVRELGW